MLFATIVLTGALIFLCSVFLCSVLTGALNFFFYIPFNFSELPVNVEDIISKNMHSDNLRAMASYLPNFIGNRKHFEYFITDM